MPDNAHHEERQGIYFRHFVNKCWQLLKFNLLKVVDSESRTCFKPDLNLET